MGPAGVKLADGTEAESPRAWLMWVLGLSAYVVAVMQRSSLGVASLQATERFSAGASLVSLFVVVQMLTYAGMQVPVGVLADRFGTRVVVSSGAVLMCLGQLDMAFSTAVSSAIVSRLLVGAGDAMTLGAVLRLLPAWFRPQRLAVLNQLTSMVGQFGQVLSSVPLAAVLGVAGWTTGFVAAGAVSALTAAAVFLLMRDSPHGIEPVLSLPETSCAEQVRRVLRIPATLLGFWIHWVCSVWLITFSLMWGYPFILSGLGYPQPVAAGLFILLVLAGIPFGPLIGALSGRAPLQRTNLAVLVSAWVALAWVAILVWPGPAPVGLLILTILGMGAAGPGSSIGFDVVRASTPLHQIGTATGVVILGGFLGGMLNVLAVGIVLDLLGGYSPVAFRWAMATQLAFWAVGVAGAYTARRKARRLERGSAARSGDSG
jgi:sugar phosphate permease